MLQQDRIIKAVAIRSCHCFPLNFVFCQSLVAKPRFIVQGSIRMRSDRMQNCELKQARGWWLVGCCIVCDASRLFLSDSCCVGKFCRHLSKPVCCFVPLDDLVADARCSVHYSSLSNSTVASRSLTRDSAWHRWYSWCTSSNSTWCSVGAFQLKVSVGQDLSVIVAETINDDDVKQRLVPIVFTRA